MSTVNYAEILRLARKGKQSEKRKAALGRFLSALAVSILGAFFGGWMLMLGVGILHANWWSDMPPMGYWTAVLAVALLRGVFSRLQLEKEKS